MARWSISDCFFAEKEKSTSNGNKESGTNKKGHRKYKLVMLVLLQQSHFLHKIHSNLKDVVLGDNINKKLFRDRNFITMGINTFSMPPSR